MRYWVVIIFLVSAMCRSHSQSMAYVIPSEDEASAFFKYDKNPPKLDLGHIGGDNIWYFTELSAPVVHEYQLKPLSQSNNSHLFTDAGEVLCDPYGNEYFVKDLGRNWLQQGLVLRLDNDMGTPLAITYENPLIIKPLCSLERGHYLSTEWSLTLDEDVLQQLSANPYRNVHIKARERHNHAPDATGILYLPDEKYMAKRVQTAIRRKYQITAELEDGQTTALSQNVIEELGIDLPSYEAYYYFFDTKDNKLLTVVRAGNADEVKSVMYRVTDIENAKLYEANKPQFVLHPSVSYGDIRLDFMNFSPGQYTITVHNIIGKELLHKTYNIYADKTILENWSELPKGTYQYSLRNEDNELVLTRRFVIIKI